MKNNETIKILKEQIEELKKLLILKDHRIAELTVISNRSFIPTYTSIYPQESIIVNSVPSPYTIVSSGSPVLRSNISSMDKFNK